MAENHINREMYWYSALIMNAIILISYNFAFVDAIYRDKEHVYVSFSTFSYSVCFCGFITSSLSASTCFGIINIIFPFQSISIIIWLRITKSGLKPEMLIWSIF